MSIFVGAPLTYGSLRCVIIFQKTADQLTSREDVVDKGFGVYYLVKFLASVYASQAGIIYHNLTSSHKSFHSGFIFSIILILAALLPALIRFSSSIASSIPGKKQ